MFTGIIEELGRVKRIQRGSKSIALTIEANKVVKDINIGDSIAVNGVCLTAADFNEREFRADVMPETMDKSNLGDLKIGDKVNLERALKAGDRLGGHLVFGHVDGVGKITEKRKDDNAVVITIKPPAELLKYMVSKGSVAVDGVSLTIVELKESSFSISLILHTAQITLLGDKKVGGKVNIETDMIGKYVERMMRFKEESKTDIDGDLLKEKGFLLA